ncbi:MAG: gamma carbonic anhydrase family protein [Gammaproteobacteria bacterium]|nr:gamma carbonic anhydrase family protein [Gammaproteobacteria bacterium]
MAIRTFLASSPQIDASAYVDETALVIGEVTIGRQSSIWPMTVIRGDVNGIVIGNESNIQDGSVLHVTHKSEHRPEGNPLLLGDRVTVGHKVILHGCQIGNDSLIGMGSVIMDGVVIEEQVLVGAGSLVSPGKRLETGYLYMGNPARRVRALSEDELAYFRYSAQHYVRLMQQYR